ncbi:MAG: putative manganese-dependent inorganic diphosphatase [Treponema sp.]|jgi:manganese-dependent inorganic pyrophosphatase|nr:putative manganese-dependent inorganic diphosphatase [Treponema sp.]
MTDSAIGTKKQKTVYIIGHRNPDTDSVVSAAAYERLKQDMGFANYAAARGGNLSPQTEYIFERFKVPVPQYVPDLAPKASYYMRDSRESAEGGTSLWTAIARMEESNTKVLPVVNADGTYCALLHYNAFVQNILKVMNPEKEAIFSTNIKLVTQTLSAQSVLAFNADEIFKCVVIVAAASLNTFKSALAQHAPENVIVITADRADIQKHCVDRGIRALALTGGVTMEKALRDAAEKKNVSVLLTPYDSSEAAILINYSAPVSTMADGDIKPVNISDPLRKVRPLLQASPSRALPVVDDKNMLVGVISENDLLQEANIEVILVDHNELSQAVEGVENYVIKEVIDHHRLGSFATKTPISFINRPVGATSTIIASLYRQNRMPIRKEIASILLSGILADTLALQSFTTTEEDRETAEYLSNITNLDVQALGHDIMTAASKIGGRNAGEVIRQDMKEYAEGAHLFTVSQIEVDTPAEILSRKKEFLDELEIERRARKALFCALMVTDITKLTSLLFIAGQMEFLQTLKVPRQEEGVYQLHDIVSRKKQLVPLLTEQIK